MIQPGQLALINRLAGCFIDKGWRGLDLGYLWERVFLIDRRPCACCRPWPGLDLSVI